MKKCSVVLGLVLTSISANSYAGYGHEGKGYTKLDLGMGAQENKQTLTRGLKTNGKDLGTGILAGGGLGYYFMDELRVDLMLYYDKGMKTKKSTRSGTTNVTIRGREESLGLFANAYFDILNRSDFIPYITGGLGYLRNEFKSTIITSTEARENKSQFAFGYQAGLGVSYHLSSNFDLDFGYRFINKGAKEYKFTITSINTDVKAEPGIVHAGIIGLRSTF